MDHNYKLIAKKWSDQLLSLGLNTEQIAEVLFLILILIKKKDSDFLLQYHIKEELLKLKQQLEQEHQLILTLQEQVIGNLDEELLKSVLDDLLKIKQEDLSLFLDVITERLINKNSAYNLFTPPEVAELIGRLSYSETTASVYDPACGSAGLLFAAAKYLPGQTSILGRTNNAQAYRFAKLLSLVKGEQNLQLNLNDRPPSLKEGSFDLIVSNPPFGASMKKELYADQGSYASKFQHKDNEVVFLTHILDHLSANGKAAVIVPSGFLSASGVKQELRKEIIQQNVLEAIIQLPSKIFYNTGVSTAILILNQQKKRSDFLMVDLNQEVIPNREQYRLKTETISETTSIFDSFRKGRNIASLTAFEATKNEVAGHDFSLHLPLYQKTEKTSSMLRASSLILEECQSLEKELVELQRGFY